MYSAARRAGLPDPQARLAAAQASLETGYGRSVKGNNLFGIKAGQSWRGKTQRFKTWEEVNGKRKNIVDRFRAYDTIEDAVRDWAGLMARNFPDVMRAKSFKEAAKGLTKGRFGAYATDSKYTSKLANIAGTYADEFDDAQPVDVASIPTPSPAPRSFDPGGILAPETAGSMGLIGSAQAEPVERAPLSINVPDRVSIPDTFSLPSNPPAIDASQFAEMRAPASNQAFKALTTPTEDRFAPASTPAPPGGILGYGIATPGMFAPQEEEQQRQTPAVTEAVKNNPLSMTPEEALAAAYEQYGQTRLAAPAQPVAYTPQAVPAPAPQPARGIVSQPSFSPPQAPSVPTGADFWSGQSDYGLASNGVQLGRDELGRNVMTSPAGQTTVQLDSGHWAATSLPGGINVSMPSMPSRERMGRMARTGLGSGAGGILGSLLGGPLGGLLGAAIGRNIAEGKGIFGGNMNPNSFPGRPAAPPQPASINPGFSRSHGLDPSERSYSPAAHDSIDRGETIGLF